MNYTRQQETFDRDAFRHPIHVIGCGATGSWAAVELCKLGVPTVHLWDFDTVEEHNIPNQCFARKQIGMRKVDAAAQLCELLGGGDTKVYTHRFAVTPETPLSGYVLVLTDTMHSRKEIFESQLRGNPSVKRLIETRMGPESLRVYSVDVTNAALCDSYAATLYADEQAEESACGTSKSVVATAQMTASAAVWALMNAARGKAPWFEWTLDCGSGASIVREV